MILPDFSNKNILVIGDVMLDRYVYGDVSRISHEAPVPVLDVRSTDETLGGAANVAANIATLGGQCHLVGVVGRDDAEAATIRRLLANYRINHTLIEASRPTTVKTRYVAALHNAHMLRADVENASPVSPHVEDRLAYAVRNHAADAVVISDYGKGVVTPIVITAALTFGRPVIVNPKGDDYTRYRGAAAITSNVAELALALGQPVASVENSFTASALLLMAKIGCDAVLITRGEHGMFIADQEGTAGFDAEATRLVDVSGAGDTVVATFALGVASGMTYIDAAQIANYAAAIVVEKKGTAQCARTELSARLSR